MDLSQVASFALAHALVIGLALVGAAFLVRFVGRALGRFVVIAGTVASAYLAWRDWQLLQSWMYPGAIFVIGVAVSAVAGWIVRAVSFVVVLALFVAAWYLVLYGWMGAEFMTTTVGSLTWVAAAILSMMTTDRLSRMSVRRIGIAARIASSAVGGPPVG